jgi:hypothetical protein
MRYLLMALLALAAPAAHAKSTLVIYNNDNKPGQSTGGAIAAGATATSFKFTPRAGTFTFASTDRNGTLIISGASTAANNGAFRVTAVDTATNTATFTNANEGAAAEPSFSGSWQFGEGFNDPMPIAPVGGNPGLTVGAQRLNAFQYAAARWGEILDSGPEILIRANFDALTCDATSAVLGSAGAADGDLEFPGAKPGGNRSVPAMRLASAAG